MNFYSNEKNKEKGIYFICSDPIFYNTFPEQGVGWEFS